MKIVFILANSADFDDEMPIYFFYPGGYSLFGIQNEKG